MPEAAAPMEAPGKGTNNVTFSAGGATTPAQTGQKLIRRVNIDAETEDLDALLESLTVQISSLGGYIEQQNLYNGSAYASYRSRNANLTIRIPADQLDGFVGQVKDASNVISYSESQEDVTLTYVSTESRIKALETEEAVATDTSSIHYPWPPSFPQPCLPHLLITSHLSPLPATC